MAASYYPVDEDSEDERVKTSVRLPKQDHDDIEIIAELWNEFDRVLDRPRPRKWKAASVIERLIEVGIDGFWGQVGGRPDTKEGREEFVRKAVEKIQSQKKRK